MQTIKSITKRFLIVATTVLAMGSLSISAHATSAEELNKDSAQALQSLYKTNPFAETMGKKAKAILVFPRILKAGLVFGGSYGEGVLTKNDQLSGYYNSVSGSWGWQAGAESYGYVLFLMTDKAVSYLNKTKGWEFGVGPSVVVINDGAAKNLTTSTLKDDAYAFVFDQQGLMVDISIKGTKISPIKR